MHKGYLKNVKLTLDKSLTRKSLALNLNFSQFPKHETIKGENYYGRYPSLKCYPHVCHPFPDEAS